MAIKIKKNGKIENFTLHSTDVKVLDLEGKFKKKDLESVIREISDTEHIHIGEVDTTKDGIWIDDGEILDNSKNNGVVERLKTFVNETIGELSSLTTSIKSNLVGAINELKGNVDQLSGTNLLINGDFQVWQRGELFTTTDTGFAMYTADRWHEWSYNPEYIGRCRVEKYNKHLKWTTVGNNGLRQCIEHNLDNLPLVFTVKIKGTKGSSFKLFMLDSISPTKNVTDVAEKKFVCTGGEDVCTLIIPKYKYTHFPTVIIQTSEVAVFEIFYAKLELGSQATPFTPRPFGEELALCQRYYEITDADTEFLGSRTNHDTFTFTYRYPVPKRVGATVKFSHPGNSDNVLFMFCDGTVGHKSCTIQKSIDTEVKWVMNVSTGNPFFGQGASAFGKIIADAEIY